MRKSVFRGFAPAVAALLAGGCGDLPDLPLGAQDLDVFWKHSDWRPRRDITFDPTQAAPSRVQRFATSTVVGDGSGPCAGQTRWSRRSCSRRKPPCCHLQ